MADGSRQATPEVRIGTPLVEDWAWLARHLRPDEASEFAAMTGRPFDPGNAATTYIASTGLKYVLVDRNNLPLAAGCFERVREGVLETWAIGTLEAWDKHWRTITKVCRRQMDGLLASGVHRIQIVAMASRIEAHEWYERGLLMQREGLMKGYCADGSDAVMFARTKQGHSDGR